MAYNTCIPENLAMSPVVVESYEATRLKSGNIVLTFDSDDFAPVGELVSAAIDGRAVLALTWADGACAMLPDVRDKLAAYIVAAPTISVRWVASGLLRGADLRQPPHNDEVIR
jgi:hypothetical protein